MLLRGSLLGFEVRAITRSGRSKTPVRGELVEPQQQEMQLWKLMIELSRYA
jgi:hypothetical protein